MSFPPPLPNNPMFSGGYPPNAVPQLTPFPIPIGNVPLLPGALPMGVTVPAGVASVSAPPVRNQNPGIIAAPPVMIPSTNALIFPPPPAMYKLQDPKKLNITTVFVGNITEKASDMLIRQLLSRCGHVHNWKRIQGPDGKVQGFGFCDYADPESAVRAIRLLHDFEIADKKLIVKVDAKAQTKIDEYKMGKEDNEEMDNLMKEEDKLTKSHLAAVLREHETELLRDVDPKTSNNQRHQSKKVDQKQEDLSGLDLEDEKKILIHREIDKFRDTYKKYDEEKEEEKRKKDDELTKSKDRDRRSRSKERDDRSRERRSRERDRRSEERDYFAGMPRPSFERRKAQEMRQKELAYQRRLRDWEAREKKKAKEYEREKEKELRRKEEEEIEKQKLKQFLQDYDDDKHDPKYYKGRVFERRKMERRKEIERDAFEQEQERKELAELNQKLAEDQPTDYDARNKRLNADASNLENLASESLRNNASLHDDDSRSSNPNGASVKTFGFAGMKISSGAENVNNVNGATTSAPSSEAPPEKSTNSASSKSEAKRKRLTVSEVFNANEDDDPNAQNGKKRRPPPNVLLEDNTDSNLSTGSNKQTNSQLSHDEKRKQIKGLIDQIPTNKNELFNYNFDWDLLDHTLMERRIRPWISKKIKDYIGEEEQTLLDFICKKLLTKSSAQSLLDDVAMVLDDEAQVFVVKLWRLLIYEIEAKKLGINK